MIHYNEMEYNAFEAHLIRGREMFPSKNIVCIDLGGNFKIFGGIMVTIVGQIDRANNSVHSP